MPRRLACLLAALAVVLPALAHDTEMRPFRAGSLAEITTARQGQPFILFVWSAGCEPCRQEFAFLRELARAKPRVPLVLVSTDGVGLQKSAVQALSQYGLEHEDNWIFAEAGSEALRREIDAKWDGKLPRTYLYDAAHNRQAVSGRLDRGRIDGWVRQATAMH
jgi:thiol-disulfide isomerase/thioredoxin